MKPTGLMTRDDNQASNLFTVRLGRFSLENFRIPKHTVVYGLWGRQARILLLLTCWRIQRKQTLFHQSQRREVLKICKLCFLIV